MKLVFGIIRLDSKLAIWGIELSTLPSKCVTRKGRESRGGVGESVVEGKRKRKRIRESDDVISMTKHRRRINMSYAVAFLLYYSHGKTALATPNTLCDAFFFDVNLDTELTG
mmetsp:Transcript_337/g.446  ORF Transcript_337/g.446 Transcript_337/m.446 type:complete len:112 (+) Transcript_337:45-380(+)